MNCKEFLKKLTLYVLVGFGLSSGTESIPVLRNYTVYVMILTLIVLSFLIEREQHNQDGTLRYLFTDVTVDVLSAIGVKKILTLLSGVFPFLPNNAYLKYAIMLAVSAAISTIYSSYPSSDDGE